MREIVFYKAKLGGSPVEDFLDRLSDKQAQKVLWVMKIVEEIEHPPKTYFKKLVDTNDIWEIRAQKGRDIFRILGFKAKGRFVVVTNGFVKKT